MLLDDVTNEDKRSWSRNVRFFILICVFNRQVHASIYIYVYRQAFCGVDDVLSGDEEVGAAASKRARADTG